MVTDEEKLQSIICVKCGFKEFTLDASGFLTELTCVNCSNSLSLSHLIYLNKIKK